MLKKFAVVFGALLMSQLPLFAETSLGEKLETQMWEDMKHRNYKAIEENIADNFQSIHSFGALNRASEIDLIKDLYLGTYDISDVKVTDNGDTLVVSYMIAVREKIDNQNLSSKPAPRLSVWQKIDGKWKWIAHVNLKSIPPEKIKALTTTPKAVSTKSGQ